MSAPTDRDWAKARKLLDTAPLLDMGGAIAAALAEERQPFLDLADHWDTDADARFSQNRIARSVAAREIRRAAGETS